MHRTWFPTTEYLYKQQSCLSGVRCLQETNLKVSTNIVRLVWPATSVCESVKVSSRKSVSLSFSNGKWDTAGITQ